jgi:hypothetical protein
MLDESSSGGEIGDARSGEAVESVDVGGNSVSVLEETDLAIVTIPKNPTVCCEKQKDPRALLTYALVSLWCALISGECFCG